MRVLALHPTGLMYSRIFLRLEPLGLELAAAAARDAGHSVRVIDLQVEPTSAYARALEEWRPDLVAISGNYLANVPEIVGLAQLAKRVLPRAFVAVGGHSVSFVDGELLEHAHGAIDCVLRGEGEVGLPALLDALAQGASARDVVPGAVTAAGRGLAPRLLDDLDAVLPARDLLRRRRKYFIGTLDPAASIEFSRGCPWDCTFCSAWTFYGRSYRVRSPESVADEIACVAEPGLFIVDDVAFIHAEHAFAIGEAIAKRGVRKQYYLETRGDVLLRNQEAFRFWRDRGLAYIFVGLEAIDEDGLRRFRKRVPLGRNFEALEFARSLGVRVAINLIVDPSWSHERFAAVREWCLAIPEIVNLTVNTPYPGTESWGELCGQLATRDYRLFDIQHAVLPTALPLGEFYRELVETQRVLALKHLGWAQLRRSAAIAARHVLRGQTNFVRMLWKFNSVYDPRLQLADHAQPVEYALRVPERAPLRAELVHTPRRTNRGVDAAPQHFVAASRSASG